MPLQPAVFLDRDGTLNVECGFVTCPEQMRLLPGVAEAIRRLRGAGYACVVITNQSGVGRGLMTEADLASVHVELRRLLDAEGATLDGLYYCAAGPDQEHPDRKPAPGMLLRAARELGLDLARSWMVGDSARDLLAGRQAGCRGVILVRSGHEVGDTAAMLQEGDHLVDDLSAAAAHIITAACR
jgi:D-glycero-D-manno-heptose 1,7-bisphosphate phosphatase